MAKYGVKYAKALAYNPQSNGQTKMSNHELKSVLEKTVNTKRKDLSLRLDNSFWAYQTAYKTQI